MKYTEVNPFTGKNIDEDAPANATGPSVAGTGDDSSVVVVRKKKKKDTLYDGRTRIARKFIERILKQRESRKLTREEVELDEVLKPKDKKVIDDFVQMNKGTGAQNFTQRGSIVDYEGRSLEKKGGMGAQQIASLESDPKDDYKIKIRAKMDGKSTQSIVNYLKKSAKKYNIKVEETVKEEPMIEVNELEEAVANLFVKGDNPNQMALKIAKNAKGLGLKSAMMGNQVRVKGSQKQVNDFMRSVLGKSSMGSPTEKGASNPQIDKMLNKQLKEEKLRNFTNFVLETNDDFGVEYLLAENNLKILQNIVKKKQNAKMKFKDNKRATVDLFTASAIMKVYDAVKPDNKKKMEKLINGTLPEFLKLQAFAMKQVKMK
tara:strand:+ start:5429 stop:6550 length:1122 start_codon:yes stop_codon:yes gene_type:complete